MEQRPVEAETRGEQTGHREADAVLGKKGGVRFTTLTDGKSRFPICRTGRRGQRRPEEENKRQGILNKNHLNKEIPEALKSEPCFSITPDRGREFAGYGGLSRKPGAKFCFPLPHQPMYKEEQTKMPTAF